MIKPAIAAAKKAVAKVMDYITNFFMSLILKAVGMFMSKEEQTRLEETQAQLKEEEAKKAEESVAFAKAEVTKTKAKKSRAEKTIDAEIKWNKTQESKAAALEAKVTENIAALDAEKTKVEASRLGFKSKYGKYFAQQDKGGAGPAPGPDAGAGGASTGAKTTPPPPAVTNAPAPGAGGGGKSLGSKDKVAAPDGKTMDAAKDATAPLPPEVGNRLVKAVDVVKDASNQSVDGSDRRGGRLPGQVPDQGQVLHRPRQQR